MVKQKPAVMERVVFFVLLLTLTFCYRVYSETPKKDGIHKEYYESGELKSETNLKGGKENGLSKTYDKSGRLLQTVKYKEGKMTSSFATEPERNLGPFKFLTDFRLWAGVVVFGVLMWLIFVKVMLKGRT